MIDDNDTLTEIRELINNYKDIARLNNDLEDKTGLINFFKSEYELKNFKGFLDYYDEYNLMNDDLGDFQTPPHLTDKICMYFKNNGFIPDTIIEPTCGMGNFVISAIKIFPNLKYIYCVEIQERYEYFFKYNLLKLSFNQKINVKIEFHRDNIFNHEFSDEFIETMKDSKNNLILGNPPWITNTELSILNSENIPVKSNIKKHRGIEAITGKGNFDIAEYIILQMIKEFSQINGKIAMLCKTSVTKNLVKDMNKLNLNIANIKSLLIDTKKEFNKSAHAGLFIADLNSNNGDYCSVANLNDPDNILKKYGLFKDKLVSHIDLYRKYGYLDGKSYLEWRQGVKHDASKVMVLKKIDNEFTNGLGETVDVEKSPLYPFLRGSMLKNSIVDHTDLNVIITQKNTSEDTSYIESEYPKLWDYLTSHAKYLDNRKSSIYKKRTRFAIFGIGDYSFNPYKIAISGLYKKLNFSLILPIDNKPVMLDDTCYILPFESLDKAVIAWCLLNTKIVENFISSIVFLDSKRPYTKELLMRIDLNNLADKTSFEEILDVYQNNLESKLGIDISENTYIKFKEHLENKRQDRLTLDQFISSKNTQKE